MPNIVKVGLSAKQSIQAQEVYDFTTGFVTRTATQYWVIEFDGKQNDPYACLGAVDPAGNRVPIVTQDYGVIMGGAAIGVLCTRTQPTLDPASAGKASAGQPFQQQRTRTYYDNVYRIGFKSNSLNPATIDPIQGCLNQGAFTLNVASLGFSKTFEAQSTLLTRCPTTTVLTGDPTQPNYWQAEYELYYRKPIATPANTTGGTAGAMVSGWTPFIVDQGYCELASGQLKQILDSTGNPLNSPQYLDGSGSKSTTAHYLQFTPDSPTADFTPLFAGIA
jgi:hypothetical protein